MQWRLKSPSGYNANLNSVNVKRERSLGGALLDIMTDKQYARGYDHGFRDGYHVGVQDGFARGYDEGTEAMAAEVRQR
jgi:hypothetical protein